MHSPFFFPGPKYKGERLEQAIDKRPQQVYQADITQKKLLSYTDKVRKDNFLYVICLAQCERDRNVRKVLTQLQERAFIYQFSQGYRHYIQGRGLSLLFVKVLVLIQ